jgi:nucleoside diphosphate kinase
MVDVEAVVKAFQDVAEKKVDHSWVKPYSPNKDTEGVHQFLFFLKPEATAAYDGVKVREVLDLATKTLSSAGVEFGAIRVLGGDYLEKHSLMVEHYGVISKISKEGVSAISDQAKEKLNTDFKDLLGAGAEVLGGHQFLNQQPQFNAFSLLVLNDNLGTKRLAGGTYAMQIKVLGKPYILLNPFHAYQLVPYTTSGHAIIAFEGLSKLPWADLRQKVCGATDPKAAEAGSIRNLFLQNREALGLGDVDKGTNGVHMSAGPLEGMVELQRFFTDHEASTQKISFDNLAFGSLLLHTGVKPERVAELAQNIDLSLEGKNVSSFDATEEKDAVESAKLLAAL